MAERRMARIIHQFEASLESFKEGRGTIEDLEKEWDILKLRVGSSIARYCDDFSTSEYWEQLNNLSKQDEREER